MDSLFDQVVASYHRARHTGQLLATFYKLFLAKSPEIPPMFARTDFPHQKLMLREATDGELKGWTLKWLDGTQVKWFAWAAEYPETSIYRTIEKSR